MVWWQSFFDVASSLWLVADMALDCVTTAGFFSKTSDYPFFVASITALFLPTVIGGFLLWCYIEKGCGCSKLCSVSIITVPLCILGFCIIWIISPILHFIQAVFSSLGVQPVGGPDFEIQVSILSFHQLTLDCMQGPGFARFWLVVLILKSCEQLLEALPQTLINVIYLDRRWHDLSEWEIAKLVSPIVNH